KATAISSIRTRTRHLLVRVVAAYLFRVSRHWVLPRSGVNLNWSNQGLKVPWAVDSATTPTFTLRGRLTLSGSQNRLLPPSSTTNRFQFSPSLQKVPRSKSPRRSNRRYTGVSSSGPSVWPPPPHVGANSPRKGRPAGSYH